MAQAGYSYFLLILGGKYQYGYDASVDFDGVEAILEPHYSCRQSSLVRLT